MGKYGHPRRGTLQFRPKSRAQSQTPRIRQWPSKEGAKILGFAGYKVGQTHIIYTENNPNLGARVGQGRRLVVTVLEVPPMKAIGYRFYKGPRAIGDILATELPKELARTINMPGKERKAHNAEALKKQATEVRLILSTQPILAGLPKKRPEIMEIGLQGKLDEQVSSAQALLGKDVQLKDVFKNGDYIDVISITTGKGFQGPVKRHGVKIRSHKAKRGRRKPANIGGWTPKRTSWRTPMGGQMGYNQRCEYNKRIVTVGEGGINPVEGGWQAYGKVNGNYIFISGSVSGPTKRLIAMRFPVRPVGKITDVPSIEYSAIGQRSEA